MRWGEEKHPVMSLHAAQWRIFNWLICVLLRKENHSGEAHNSAGRLSQTLIEEGAKSFDGPQKTVALQRNALCLG